MLSPIMSSASLSLAVASDLLPRVWLKFILELRLVCLSEFVAVVCQHSTSRRPARCLTGSRPFLLVFPIRCALLAQRLHSVRLACRFFALRSFRVSVPSLASPVSYRVFASSVPFPVELCAVRPSFPPRPFRFPFRRASSTQSSFSGCLYSCLVSRCFQAR